MAAAFVTSIIGALSGFGGGILVMPFLVPVVGIKGVVPVMSIAMLIANFSRFWVYRAEVRSDVLVRLGLASLPGVILGTYIYQLLPDVAIATLIGLFLIGSIGLRRGLKGRALQFGPSGTAAWSFGFGVLTGSTPGAGVVLVVLLLGMGMSGPALIATDAVIGMLSSVTKAVMFSTFDLLDLRSLAIGLLVGLATIPGAFTARWMINNLSASVHVMLIEAMVIVAGLSFLWRAWSTQIGAT
ncbi:MAG: sulfite exporter TauE/SafE family protein [Pseudomonadota bacterium]